MNLLRIIKYGKYFTNDKLTFVLGKFGRNVVLIKKVLVLYYCMRDPDTPKYVKAVLLGMLGYLALPIDILPDAIPLLGKVDDLVLMGIVYKFAQGYVKEIHIEKALKKVPFGDTIL